MKQIAFAVLVTLAATSSIEAADGICATADHLVSADYALPQVAAAVARKQLNVVVVGSASSALSVSGKAYPARLEAALTRELPGVAVKVTSIAKSRESARDMEDKFAAILAAEKPSLVVWQTGTADAIRGVDPDDFRGALDDGVDEVQKAKTDMLFINMQYSPRTDSMITLTPYSDGMRFVSLQREINLFDRQSIMRLWNELGTFDLSAATKKLDVAEQVHDCLGQLLADLIVRAANPSGMARK